MRRMTPDAGLLLLAVALLLPCNAVAQGELRPPDAFLQDIVDVRISDPGLDFLAELLGNGLLQPTLKQDIIGALEGQSFEVLVPNDLGGGTAQFLVDFADDSDIDGFRYDDLTVELATVPASTNLVPEAGVLYPKINLNGWSGADPSGNPNLLPELWLLVNYPPFVTDVPAVARARLATTGVLRPYIGPGTVGFLVEDFDTQIFQFEVNIFDDTLGQDFAEALGQAVQDEFSKELGDALSDVLQSGINDILFDRDLDGEADTLLNLEDLFTGLNETIGTDFGFAMEPNFQTNATFPTTVLLRTDGAMFLNTPGEDCVGPDVNDGFLFTLLENDGVAGHDPPQILETPPGATETAQFVLTVSDDFINQILFNAYRTGFACLFLNPLAPGVPTDITDLLVTDSLSLFLGDWITDAFPGAPVGLRARMLRAPFAELLPTGGDHQMLLRLPSIQVDLMVYEHERWLRLMGTEARIDLSIGINDIDISGENQLLDVSFSFAVSNVLNFADFVPDRRAPLQNLLPTALSLAESAMADLLGGPAGDITDCIAGLDVSLFELATLGQDSDFDYAHYLGLWLSLSGEVDLGFLFECLLGAPLVDGEVTGETTDTTETASVFPKASSKLLLGDALQEPVVPVLGGVTVDARVLAGDNVVRWRFVPGFWHAADEVVPALPAGARLFEWENAQGQRQQMTLVGGSEPGKSHDDYAGGCGVAGTGQAGSVLALFGLFWLGLRRTYRRTN